MKKCLFSLCVTVYNLESYIEECLKSILEQEFDDYELIVVDNGSSDGGIEICRQYALLYPNKMRFIALPPPTVMGRAATIALEEARGEYIHIIDGDDYVVKGYLKELSKIIKERNPDLIVGNYRCIVEKGGRVISDTQLNAEKINSVSYDKAIHYIFSKAGFQKTNWRLVFKRKDNIVIKYRRYCYERRLMGRYGDLAMVTAQFLWAESIYYYESPFYFYRCRKVGSLTANMNVRGSEDYFKALMYLQVLVCKAEKEKKNTKERQEVISIVMRQLIKLFLANSDLIGKIEMNDLKCLLKYFGDEFISLREYKIEELKRLVACVEGSNKSEGLEFYCKYYREGLSNKLDSLEYNEIYVMPTGIAGESVGRFLSNNGYPFKAYLDNSQEKQKLTIQGKQCLSPMILRNIVEDKHVAVIVSTIYQEYEQLFYNQLKAQGIKNIIKE